MNTLTQMGWIQSKPSLPRKDKTTKGFEKSGKKGSTKKLLKKHKKRKVCNQLPSKPSSSKCGHDNECIKSKGNDKETFMKLFKNKTKKTLQIKLPEKCETCITYPVYLNGKCRMCLHL